MIHLFVREAMDTLLWGHRTWVFFWGGGTLSEKQAQFPKRNETSCVGLKTMAILYFDETQMIKSLEATESMVLYFQSHRTHSD